MKRHMTFFLVPRKPAPEGALAECRPIKIRVSYGGNRAEMRLGHSIEPEKWNPVTQRVRQNTRSRFGESAGEINREITRAEDLIEEIFARFDAIDRRVPTPEELRAAYYEATGRARPDPAENPAVLFQRAYSEFTETMGRQNGWTVATHRKFNTIFAHLRRWRPDVSFPALSAEGLQEFLLSLQKEGLRNTTIAKDLQFLKWFLKWSLNRGYEVDPAFESFRPRLKGTDGNQKEIVYLEWEELMKLYSFPLKSPRLRSVRDVFCFCCFTGLRYSDVAKLKRSDVHERNITVVTQKTADSLVIELNKYSRAILDRYAGITFKRDLALPVISNVKMNEYLKELGQEAGLDAPQRIVFFRGNERLERVFPKYAVLTTHCARRTFVVNALRMGIPAEVVMKWTGHSDFKSMKPYVKIVDKLKEAEMSKFDTFSPGGK